MRTLVVVLTLVLVSPTFAKKHKEQPYDHTGKLIYHPVHLRNLLEGRDDIYHVDDYECTPGTEHYAPTCRTYADWHVIDVPAYAEIILEDGTRIAVMMFAPKEGQHLEGNPSVLLCEKDFPVNPFCSVSHIWLGVVFYSHGGWISALGERFFTPPKMQIEATFRYRYRDGSKEIEYDWKSLPDRELSD